MAGRYRAWAQSWSSAALAARSVLPSFLFFSSLVREGPLQQERWHGLPLQWLTNISPGVDGPAIRSLKSYLRLPQLPLTVGGVIELQQGRALAPDVLRQRHVPHQHLIPAT